MQMQSYAPGVPSWVDLGTPDPAVAATFYGQLFGWTIDEGPAEAGGYRMAMLRGQPVAGIAPLMHPGPPSWMTYVNVESVDAVLAKVPDNGGQVLAAGMDVMDVGRMGVLADPLGAVISLWQPGTHPGAGLVNEPGTYGWSELLTTDVDKSKTFYGAVLGWGAETHGHDEQSAYTEWKVNGESVGGLMQKPPMMPAEMPPFWAVYFVVEDADAAVAAASSLGGTLTMGPMDIEPGRIAVIIDPTGATFSVMALKPELQGS
jgi:predicted enzyme related to lactoylglutathione lyase